MKIIVTEAGIEAVLTGFENLTKRYPKEVNNFLRREGGKLKTRTTKMALGKIKSETGNYMNGITVQKPYKYYRKNSGKAKDSVKVYGRKERKTVKVGTKIYSKGRKKIKTSKDTELAGAYHTHLIEKGHKKVLWGNRTAERVKAFYVYRDAGESYESIFESNCGSFIDNFLAQF